MDYQPSLPAHNDNVSHEHPLKDFAVIAAYLLAAAVLLFWLLGMAVDAMVDRLSADDEARLVALMPSINVTTASALRPRQQQLQAMVDGMRSCAGLAGPARVVLNKSAQANAAVAPGGAIIVFTGLAAKVQSENGLAFVLAHELAHLRQRDHLRAMGRAIVVFGVVLAVTGTDAGLVDLLAPVHQLGQAKYSRTREAAADALALRILVCRYGHAGGATELFEAMKGDDQGIVGLSHYGASHPAMQERIDAMQQAIRDGAVPVGAVLPLQLATD